MNARHVHPLMCGIPQEIAWLIFCSKSSQKIRRTKSVFYSKLAAYNCAQKIETKNRNIMAYDLALYSHQ